MARMGLDRRHTRTGTAVVFCLIAAFGAATPLSAQDAQFIVEALPPENWKAAVDPPAQPPAAPFSDKFKIAIPARRIDANNIVYPVTDSPLVIVGTNESERESRELWNLATAQKAYTLKGVRINTTQAVALSADGHYVAWESGTFTIDVYDIKAKKPLGKLTTGNNDNKFYGKELALVPGDRLVALANVQKSFKVWQLPGGELKHTVSVGEQFGYPDKSAYSPGGKFMAVEADHLERTIRLYNLETGQAAGELKTKRLGVVISLSQLAFSPDGSELACLCDEAGSKSATQIIVWNMADGSVKQNIGMSPGIKDKLKPDSQALGLQWFADGKKFLVHGMAIVDRASGQMVYTFEKPQVGTRSVRRALGTNLVASLDGDRMGGTLKPIVVSDEELSRAAAVADSGGLPEDLKLPPLTRADFSNTSSPSAATEWKAQPDPAPALATGVLATPLPFQIGKGTPRAVHIVGGKTPKAFVRVADGENTTDVKLKFPEVDIRAVDGKIITRSRPRPIVAKENWIDVYDLVAKKAAGKIAVPFSGEFASVSPDGALVLVQAHNAKGRLDVFDTAGKHIVGFRPYQLEGDERDWSLDAAVMLDADHAVTINVAQDLVAWKLPECQPLYTISKAMLPTLSPGGKLLAIASPQGVDVRDARTGAGQGVIALEGTIRALAFHPQGDRLAILLQDRGGAYLYVADMKTGALGEEIPSPINTESLIWCGDNHLLCDQTALLDLAAKTVAWSYKLNAGFIASSAPDSRLWYAAPKSPRVPALQLVAATLPEAKLAPELAKVKLEPEIIAQPGSPVALKFTVASAPWGPTVAQQVPKLLTESVQKAGVTVAEGTPPLKITVTGTSSTGKPFELSKIGDRSDKITIQDNQYELKVVYTSGTEVIWQNEFKISSQTSTGLITRVPPNKSAQQVIDEAMVNRIERYCEGLAVPAYVFSKKSREGLGSSTLGGDGPVPGPLKK
jgi:WD40 repeat protein